jgi:hypothetical protein
MHGASSSDILLKWAFVPLYKCRKNCCEHGNEKNGTFENYKDLITVESSRK